MLTLNDQQTLIFDKIRTCCLDKVNGKNPDPFRIISLTLRRQKNQEFAKTLNRLRKHEKGDELYERDEVLLKQRQIGSGELSPLGAPGEQSFGGPCIYRSNVPYIA